MLLTNTYTLHFALIFLYQAQNAAELYLGVFVTERYNIRRSRRYFHTFLCSLGLHIVSHTTFKARRFHSRPNWQKSKKVVLLLLNPSLKLPAGLLVAASAPVVMREVVSNLSCFLFCLHATMRKTFQSSVMHW